MEHRLEKKYLSVYQKECLRNLIWPKSEGISTLSLKAVCSDV